MLFFSTLPIISASNRSTIEVVKEKPAVGCWIWIDAPKFLTNNMFMKPFMINRGFSSFGLLTPIGATNSSFASRMLKRSHNTDA